MDTVKANAKKEHLQMQPIAVHTSGKNLSNGNKAILKILQDKLFKHFVNYS